jgi:hypothetical protein
METSCRETSEAKSGALPHRVFPGSHGKEIVMGLRRDPWLLRRVLLIEECYPMFAGSRIFRLVQRAETALSPMAHVSVLALIYRRTAQATMSTSCERLVQRTERGFLICSVLLATWISQSACGRSDSKTSNSGGSGTPSSSDIQIMPVARTALFKMSCRIRAHNPLAASAFLRVG